MLIPAVDIFAGWKDVLASLHLFLEESLEVEKLLTGHFVLEHAQPALMEGFDLELEEAFLFVTELCKPGFFVELGV